jgi:tetratricopeptide (TPR) repeat protein
MKSSSLVKQLGRKLREGTGTIEEAAEFIQLLTGETDLEVLKSVLGLNYDYTGVILERIVELIPNDFKAWLSLALWKYNNGLNDEALEAFEKARELAPNDQDVLRAGVWFSFSRGTAALMQHCDRLLRRFPNDRWAKGLCRKIQEEGKLEDLESPNWDNPWQELVNRAT